MRAPCRLGGQRGQALPLVLAAAALVVSCTLGLAAMGAMHVARGGARLAADLAALSAGRALLDALPDALADPWDIRGRLTQAVGDAARMSAVASGAQVSEVRLLSGDPVPTQVEVRVTRSAPMGLSVTATARVGLAASAREAVDGPTGWATGGGYTGPVVYRDAKPMCPMVAAAFDQMDRAAHGAGLDLVVVSAFRPDAEQAVLFARHPDPKWVAPPGRSRHRDATELDLEMSGGVHEWLTRSGGAFGFIQRYSWEPWHWGYPPGCGVAGAAGVTSTTGAANARMSMLPLPSWVPPYYRDLVLRSARVAGVAPTLLAAVLKAESDFDARAVSGAGAQGIAQFMPGTARGMGVTDPFDPDDAVPGSARLIASGVREFGSVPLAIAAYNAGSGAVHRYGGIPPYPETQAYVARVLALAGQAGALGPPGSSVVLVRAGELLA